MFKTLRDLRDTLIVLRSIDRKLNAIIVYLHKEEKEKQSVLKKVEK